MRVARDHGDLVVRWDTRVHDRASRHALPTGIRVENVLADERDGEEG